MLGKKFLVKTNHGSLAWLMKLQGQVAKWLEMLSECNFDIHYRVGRKH